MIYPLLIVTEGLINKNPLSISTDGFLFIEVPSGIPIYKKRPGPYFYTDGGNGSVAGARVSGVNTNISGAVANAGVSSPSSPNRKRS